MTSFTNTKLYLRHVCLIKGAHTLEIQPKAINFIWPRLLSLDNTIMWLVYLQEHAHPSGLYLKCSILLRHDPHDARLPSVMEETLSNSELTLELALSTIRLAAQHNRSMHYHIPTVVGEFCRNGLGNNDFWKYQYCPYYFIGYFVCKILSTNIP